MWKIEKLIKFAAVQLENLLLPEIKTWIYALVEHQCVTSCNRNDCYDKLFYMKAAISIRRLKMAQWYCWLIFPGILIIWWHRNFSWNTHIQRVWSTVVSSEWWDSLVLLSFKECLVIDVCFCLMFEHNIFEIDDTGQKWSIGDF